MNVRIIEIRSPAHAESWLRRLGVDPYAVPVLAAKSPREAVLIKHLDNRAANILKQDALSVGGDAAVHRSVCAFSREAHDVLVFGTAKQYAALAKKLERQPFGLRALAGDIAAAMERCGKQRFILPCGARKLRIASMPLIMGVLNVTPDSFYDGGTCVTLDAALARADAMVRDGAALIDIGGESSRPGARPVSVREEIARVVPVIRALARRVRVPLSVDTYKAETAKAALDAGATIINDITAVRHERGALARVAARSGAGLILMHMRGTPRTMQRHPEYDDVVDEVFDFFTERVAFAEHAGVNRANIMLDPGIGFGKTVEHNCELLRRLGEFRSLGSR